MVKIGFYVPESHLSQVKESMFRAGAGRIGNYRECCWQCLGQGQFKPAEGSEPFIGDQGVLQVVDEYRVEMVCENSCAAEVISALKKAHPYEEPAYDVCELLAL